MKSTTCASWRNGKAAMAAVSVPSRDGTASTPPLGGPPDVGDEQDAEVPEPGRQEVEQGHGVVVAGDDDHLAGRIRQTAEDVEDEGDGVVGSDRPVEQVAGDDHEVDLLVPGDGDELVEDLLELGPPIDPAQLLADVPVGGVEDPHGRPPAGREARPVAGQGGELLGLIATSFFRTSERNTFVTVTHRSPPPCRPRWGPFGTHSNTFSPHRCAHPRSHSPELGPGRVPSRSPQPFPRLTRFSLRTSLTALLPDALVCAHDGVGPHGCGPHDRPSKGSSSATASSLRGRPRREREREDEGGPGYRAGTAPSCRA